eukprot:CAMPEP_0174275074 /NCGR_PEP_ID=MMETSP0439-20130205/59626_1 /TAXON_ID=0 /ORGANISM="Stereomyxa ramosa, Strain Chinc5" /LENGTH=355 /DNA_ID=CAMNT_0015367149 /DNA_START=1052 /DNA_END=2120 /DNA_ORIENTATION=+
MMGRAMWFHSPSFGWVDLKGTGTAHPIPEVKKTGVSQLPMLLCEFLKSKIVTKVLEHSGVGIRTLPYYAILSYSHHLLPSIAHSYATYVDSEEVGLVVRQVHQKPANYLVTFDDTENIERLLRHYGITASNPAKYEPIEGLQGIMWVNIQASKAMDLVDFEGYHLVRHVTKRLCHKAAAAECPKTELSSHILCATHRCLFENNHNYTNDQNNRKYYTNFYNNINKKNTKNNIFNNNKDDDNTKFITKKTPPQPDKRASLVNLVPPSLQHKEFWWHRNVTEFGEMYAPHLGPIVEPYSLRYNLLQKLLHSMLHALDHHFQDLPVPTFDADFSSFSASNFMTKLHKYCLIAFNTKQV